MLATALSLLLLAPAVLTPVEARIRDRVHARLIGHLDTVFEPGDGFDRVVRRDGYMLGPGVFDMKGGDVAVLYTLEALNAEGALDGTDITVAFTGDEAEKAAARRALVTATKDSLPGTKAVFRFVDGYPAMSPRAANRALFGTLDGVSRDLGYGPLGLVPPQDRGAADISFVAPHVEACLAGLGVAGSGAHDPSERMKIAHLEVATVRAALLVLRLTR